MRTMVFSASLTAFVLGASACAGDSAAPELEGPGTTLARVVSAGAADDSVRRAPHDPDFIEDERFTVFGVRGSSGDCRLHRSFSLEPGESRRIEKVVEVREATCEYTIAQGRLRAEPGSQPGTRTMLDSSVGSTD